jgi:hypothetical protein
MSQPRGSSALKEMLDGETTSTRRHVAIRRSHGDRNLDLQSAVYPNVRRPLLLRRNMPAEACDEDCELISCRAGVFGVLRRRSRQGNGWSLTSHSAKPGSFQLNANRRAFVMGIAVTLLLEVWAEIQVGDSMWFEGAGELAR